MSLTTEETDTEKDIEDEEEIDSPDMTSQGSSTPNVTGKVSSVTDLSILGNYEPGNYFTKILDKLVCQ